MICRITGRIQCVNERSVVIDVGPMSYEILVPASSIANLQRLLDNEVSLHTVVYLDGGTGSSQMTPRMLGFLTPSDREFFLEFIKVKNVGMRKALRAMSLPSHQLAAAIEHGDDRTLSALPEIGTRTAAQIIAQLKGKLTRFVTQGALPAPLAELNEPQRLALEMLVTWGDRPADAQRWLSRVADEHPDLTEPDQLVKAAYRVKHGAPS